ncbi:TIMELESS-interacting protein [Araneus ventricosus]|uniref:TIMELESS-interacting protein n=1 Tax=Araneus ventricosus TaxID=182803 RepID=A0A4Y2G4A4_ARAVE|nr:TIMELESS-interacting protein [Araneus ventricosus]
MEEDGDDLDNLFDEYESNDPQPQENVNNENAENEAAVPEKVPVPKRVVKPRLKFNPERLCGKKGLPVLVDHFKDVKFKGKGHEKENLKKLLTTLELWTHRLFPSMKFEDCLRQIEHLGKKRPVKTCVQKIRNDFPILDEDFVRNEDEEEEQEQSNELEHEPPAQDAFDRLFGDYRESAQPVITSTPSSSQNVGNVLGTSFGASMSEEQKKRMEYNKMLAIERRKARESAMQSSSLVNSTETDNTTNVESVLNSASTERDNNDANFLFDYLQQQFTNTEVSGVNKKTERRCSQTMQLKDRKESEMTESVDEGDQAETDHDVLPNARNNDCREGNGKEELGLDELMDLVDEGERDETDHDTPCLKNNDESDKNETVCNALSNVRHNVCPDGSGKEELGLDELMDLVDEGDKNETDIDAVSCATNHEKGDKDEIDHDALSNVRNNDYPEGNSKEELGFDELMDLLEKDQDKKDCDEQINEIDAGFQDQHAEKTDDEL